MNTEMIKQAPKAILGFIKQNQSSIAIGIGIVGTVKTGFMIAKAAPKAAELLEEHSRKPKENVTPELYSENRFKAIKLKVYEKVPFVEKVVTIAPVYWPAWVMGAASIGLILYGHKLDLSRNAALASAYTLSEKSLKEYQNKVIETIGEKKEKGIRNDIHKDRIEENPPVESSITKTGKGKHLCYDFMSGRYFYSDIEEVRKAVNTLNSQLLSEGYKSLNDFYELLGLESVGIGDDYGWEATDPRDLVDPDFSSQLTKDGEPCLVVDFVERPSHNYAAWY